jgi:hypothetical protein
VRSFLKISTLFIFQYVLRKIIAGLIPALSENILSTKKKKHWASKALYVLLWICKFMVRTFSLDFFIVWIKVVKYIEDCWLCAFKLQKSETVKGRPSC